MNHARWWGRRGTDVNAAPTGAVGRAFLAAPVARLLRAGIALTTCAALLIACSGSSPDATERQRAPDLEPLSSVGAGEGELDLIAWAGYAEDGSGDSAVDWVTPFEQQTGCRTTVTIGHTSDEMVDLMRTGRYDGLSASGDATLRLIYAGDVAPVNTALVPHYETISPFLKDQPWNSVDGRMYGIPHGWGANLLMYNIGVVRDAPNSWAAVFDDAAQYRGRVTAYDSPIYIADAALYLSKSRPELGIGDPYSLTVPQLDAAVELLEAQRENVGLYWSDYTTEVQAFESGTAVIGTTWQVIANTIGANNRVQVNTVLPKEGSTGWSDTWMISSKAAHPNCMYKWMDWIASPEVNAQAAEHFGEAPAQSLACDYTTAYDFCDLYHATDEQFAAKIHYWTTPQKECVDGSGDDCTTYDEWVQRWQRITR
jgi:putative spermidine/putrescine transport system substrate-binding protein